MHENLIESYCNIMKHSYLHKSESNEIAHDVLWTNTSIFILILLVHHVNTQVFLNAGKYTITMNNNIQ